MQLSTMPFALPNFFYDRIQKNLTEASNEFWFIFKDTKLLVQQDTMQPFQTKDLAFKSTLYMGIFKESHIHIAEALLAVPPLGAIWQDLRGLYGKIDEALFALAGRAAQLIVWHHTHQFCGECGSQMTDSQTERAKECTRCHLLAYPRICPAMMALIRKGDEILLARGTRAPIAFYSLLAGFVEPGETLEQCVEREVFEEVGLQVEDIQYFGSQAWPFPNSLMIAFTCKWKSGEIKIDPSEIVDAQWFKKDNLPLLPPAFSLSRILIDAAITRQLDKRDEISHMQTP